jgi:CheY-like chemotaxis protein
MKILTFVFSFFLHICLILQAYSSGHPLDCAIDIYDLIIPDHRVALVVDDDAMIRTLSEVILRSKDFKVITAVNGFEASKILKINKQIRLIVTDNEMPVWTGSELARFNHQEYGLPLILQTGRLSSLHYPSLPRDVVVLEKPAQMIAMLADTAETLLLHEALKRLSYNNPKDSQNSKSILLVILDSTERRIYSNMLRHHGYKVIEADSQEQIFQLLGENPDVASTVFLDAELEDPHTFQFIRNTRETNPHIKFVGLYRLNRDPDSYATYGMPGLSKPVRPADLINEIKKVD